MIAENSNWNLELVGEFELAIRQDWKEQYRLFQLQSENVTFYFVEHDQFFKAATSSESIYTPGVDQYLFFSEAVLDLPKQLGWQPNVVHCNDWQTGFIPVLMREKYTSRFQDVATLYTIHNLAYQGEFGSEILDDLGLPRSLYVPERLETYGGVNFLKSGCVYSDQVNTVSPTYAVEIQTPEYGCRLEGLMKWLAENGRLTGILNGIDLEVFNPETDSHLPEHFSAANLAGKAKVRTALLQRVELPKLPNAALVGSVTRLSSQKGLDLLAAAVPLLTKLNFQLIVQGLGDPSIASKFRELQLAFPSHVRLIEKFDEEIAHNIYGGTDLFAMPSSFEPCGLGQMISLRYGSLPLVRGTGGLADTVFDGQNGFVFQERSVDQLVDAFTRARACFDRPDEWEKMVQRGMDSDFSWARSASQYEDVYRTALAVRPELLFTG